MSKETTGITGVADRVMNLKVTSIICCSASSFALHVMVALFANEKTDLVHAFFLNGITFISLLLTISSLNLVGKEFSISSDLT